jgi:two-component system, OmpR family, sensor histidine kinase VanS
MEGSQKERVRRRGLSVRLKLTLSYAGFLLVAWGTFVLVMAFVLHYVPDRNLIVADSNGGFAPDRSALIEAATPVAVWGTACLAAVGLIGGWLIAGQILKPLAAISSATKRAARGSLSHRIDLAGPSDEFRVLADVFDDMLSQLEHAFDEQRRFTSNASHELRTPHAVIKTMLEVACADPQRDVDQLIGRLTEINNRSIASLESLLQLARIDHAPLQRGACDLTKSVERSLTDLNVELSDRRIQLDVNLEPATVIGDRTLLGHLTDNLLRNAIRHNFASDGLVQVTTGTNSQGESVLEIANTGDPLTPGLAATLTEPFVRGAGRVRSTTDPVGSGLGLSIVASIAHAHEARLSITPRQGGGLAVAVSFPQHRPASPNSE